MFWIFTILPLNSAPLPNHTLIILISFIPGAVAPVKPCLLYSPCWPGTEPFELFNYKRSNQFRCALDLKICINYSKSYHTCLPDHCSIMNYTYQCSFLYKVSSRQKSEMNNLYSRGKTQLSLSLKTVINHHS